MGSNPAEHWGQLLNSAVILFRDKNNIDYPDGPMQQNSSLPIPPSQPYLVKGTRRRCEVLACVMAKDSPRFTQRIYDGK